MNGDRFVRFESDKGEVYINPAWITYVSRSKVAGWIDCDLARLGSGRTYFTVEGTLEDVVWKLEHEN